MEMYQDVYSHCLRVEMMGNFFLNTFLFFRSACTFPLWSKRHCCFEERLGGRGSPVPRGVSWTARRPFEIVSSRRRGEGDLKQGCSLLCQPMPGTGHMLTTARTPAPAHGRPGRGDESGNWLPLITAKRRSNTGDYLSDPRMGDDLPSLIYNYEGEGP